MKSSIETTLTTIASAEETLRVARNEFQIMRRAVSAILVKHYMHEIPRRFQHLEQTLNDWQLDYPQQTVKDIIQHVSKLNSEHLFESGIRDARIITCDDRDGVEGTLRYVGAGKIPRILISEKLLQSVAQAMRESTGTETPWENIIDEAIESDAAKHARNEAMRIEMKKHTSILDELHNGKYAIDEVAKLCGEDSEHVQALRMEIAGKIKLETRKHRAVEHTLLGGFHIASNDAMDDSTVQFAIANARGDVPGPTYMRSPTGYGIGIMTFGSRWLVMHRSGTSRMIG